MSEESTLFDSLSDLYLFLSIIFLAFLSRFLAAGLADFSSALFACISVPATYSLVYYRRRAKRMRFVEPKGEAAVAELGRLWIYELVAVLASYATAYVVFVASTGLMDLFLFTLAFFTAQGLRLFILVLIRLLRALKIDASNPLVMFSSSFLVSLLFFTLLCVFFPYI